MRIEALSYDVFLALLVYLDVPDVLALGKSCKHFREHALTHRTWIELGRRLVRNGIPLPTEGFKTPDELNPPELFQSIVKADRIFRAWTSNTARATKLTIISEADYSTARLERHITKVVPLTSDIVIVAWWVSLVFWDVARRVRLADFPRLYTNEVDIDSVSWYEGNLPSRTFYFVLPEAINLEDREIFHTTVVRADLDRLLYISSERHSSVCFEEVTSLRLLTSEGQLYSPRCFVLDPDERRVCQFYTKHESKEILLFVVLDWNTRKAAFVNTGVRDTKANSPSRADGHTCTWDAQSERLVLNLDNGLGVLYQYVFQASQFSPFMTAFKAFDSGTFNVDAIPRVSPTLAFSIAYGDLSGCIAANNILGQTAFRTSWYKFSGAEAPSPCSRPFFARIEPKEDVKVGDLLRGHILIGTPSLASASTDMALACAAAGPCYIHDYSSFRYGAFAWHLPNFSERIAIARFSYSTSKVQRVSARASQDLQESASSLQIAQLPEDDIGICTPLSMDGQILRPDRIDDSGLANLSIDEVHGRLFLVFKNGKIAALHFG